MNAVPTLMKQNRARLEDIVVEQRLRPVSEAGVESLIASITENGVMKDAIHLRKKKNGKLYLIAGAHRLEAARRLGWDEVEVKIWTDVTDDWAQMMEIDDNLAGAEMNALDTAVFLAQRKAIYERLHPETKAGVAGATARWDATDIVSVASFATATAEKFGLSDRHIRRMIAAGTKLDPRDVMLLRKAPEAVKLKDIMELSKISDPVERYDVVHRLSSGKANSISDARKALKVEREGEAPVKDPVDQQYLTLSNAFTRASQAAKRRFVEQHGVELIALLGYELGVEFPHREAAE